MTDPAFRIVAERAVVLAFGCGMGVGMAIGLILAVLAYRA